MKRIVLFFLLFIRCHAEAQNRGIPVKLSPLAAVDEFSFPGIQAGIELPFLRSFSWFAELGIKYREPAINKPDTSFFGSRGFKIKSEFRYYIEKNTGSLKMGHYAGINFFLIRDDHNTQVTYYPDSSSTARKDAFGVRKRTIGMNFLYGYQQKISGRILIDLYAGFGIRQRNVLSSRKEFNPSTDRLDRPIDPNIPYLIDRINVSAGRRLLPNLTAGFRIGIVL